MPIHLPFHVPRIPDFLKRPLDPTQTLEAFEHYAEKAIDFATRHGGEIGRNIMDDLVDVAKPYAAALDIGVDALLPGINLYYGEKWASSQGRKNPFKQKGGVVRPKSSQLPAQRMPSKWGPQSRKTRNQFNRYVRKRLRKLGSGMPKVRGNISVPGRHYKSRTRRPSTVTKFTKKTYDDRVSETRNHALWMNMNTHGSDNRAIDIVSAATLRAMLATINVYPDSWDEPIHVPSTQRVLYVRYRRVEISTGNNAVSWGDAINLHNRTFKAVAEELSDQFIDFAKLRNSPGTPTITEKGYYPYAFQFEGPDFTDAVGGSVNVHGSGADRDLSMAKVTLKCMQVIRIQNVTPNDAGGLDTTQADRNPIRGKVYHCTNRFPRVLDSVLETHGDYTQFHDNSGTGVWGGPELTYEDPISHPPQAKALFKNISKVQDVYLGLGATQSFKTYYTETFTLGRFMSLLANVHDVPKRFGGTITFGLEQAMRSGENSPVSISVNRELHMNSHLQLKRKKHILQSYASSAITI